MKRIGIIANIGKPDAASVLRALSETADALQLDLVVCDETARYLPGASHVPSTSFGGAIEALIALGGDGTMLHAVRSIDGADIPVLGVNLGSLGFMTHVTEEAVGSAVEDLAAGRYSVSKRSRLDGRVWREGLEVAAFAALNDLVIGWGASSRALTLALAIESEEIGQYLCDGLIVSTPTGSTGHSLSAGGPIVHPEAPVFTINVICPHTLSARPLVLPDRQTLWVEVLEVPDHKRPLLSADGQSEFLLEPGDRLTVSRHPKGVRFVCLSDYSYFSVLRQKLHWRGSAR